MKCGSPNWHCKREVEAGSRLKHCAECRDYLRVYSRLKRRKRARAGLCIFGGCTECPIENRRHCTKHLRYFADKTAARRGPKLGVNSQPHGAAPRSTT